MTIDEIKKWMLESSGFPVTQANAEYLERFQAIAFQAGAASRDAEIAKLKSVPMKYRRMAFNAQLQDENDQLREQVALLREEVTRCRDWFEAQAKVKSKGGPSSWELMLLRDERDAADEALAASEPKITKPT